MPNPNADLLDSPRSRDLQFDYDAQERRLHAMLDDLYKMESALRDLISGAAPKRIVDIEQQSAYATQLTALKAGLVASVAAIKAIDALEAA